MGLTNILATIWIVFFVTAALCWAKHLFGKWLNPLALYSVIWAFCLCAYETQLIRWPSISPVAWAYMIIAWLGLFLGATMVLAFRRPPKSIKTVDVKRLRAIIVFFSIIGIVGIFDQVVLLTRTFGGLSAALLIHAGGIYGSRTTGELNSLPYVGSCAYAASALAGLYTAKRGKFTWVGLMPLFVVAIQSVLSMSRFGLLLGLLLFVVTFVYTPKEVKFSTGHKRAGIAVAVIVMFAGFLFVSMIRGMVSDFQGESPEMAKIKEVVPIFPSIYTNFAAPPVAFSMYLDAPEHPKSWWGMYTFAPFFRLLSKFGFDTAVPEFEEEYGVTNTNTYLKNLYSDFGPLALVVMPFLFGMFAGMLHQRLYSPVCVVLMAFLVSVLAFSFMFSITVLGDWYIGFVVALLSIVWVQRRPMWRLPPSRYYAVEVA